MYSANGQSLWVLLWSEMGNPRMSQLAVIDHDLLPETSFLLDGDSAPRPPGFIAFGPECAGRGSGLHRPTSFRRLTRRSGRIPAEPYPPLRRTQIIRTCKPNPNTDSFCTYYGPELTSRHILGWSEENKISLIHIQLTCLKNLSQS